MLQISPEVAKSNAQYSPGNGYINQELDDCEYRYLKNACIEYPAGRIHPAENLNGE